MKMKDRFVSSHYSDTLGNCARLSIYGDRDEKKIIVHLYIQGVTFSAINTDKEFDASDFPVVLKMYECATDCFKEEERIRKEECERG